MPVASELQAEDQWRKRGICVCDSLEVERQCDYVGATMQHLSSLTLPTVLTSSLCAGASTAQ